MLVWWRFLLFILGILRSFVVPVAGIHRPMVLLVVLFQHTFHFISPWIPNPVLVLPLLVGKIRRESSKTRTRLVLRYLINERSKSISNYSFSFPLFFPNVPSNRNFNTFHSISRCRQTSLFRSRDEWTKARIIFLFSFFFFSFSFLFIAITHTVSHFIHGYFVRCHGIWIGTNIAENVRPMLEFRETIHALCHSEAV